MLSCFSAVCRPRKARPRRRARGLEKRERVRPEARPIHSVSRWVCGNREGRNIHTENAPQSHLPHGFGVEASVAGYDGGLGVALVG